MMKTLSMSNTMTDVYTVYYDETFFEGFKTRTLRIFRFVGITILCHEALQLFSAADLNYFVKVDDSAQC